MYASANSGNFYVDYGGNEHLSGTLTTAKGGPYVRATGSSGAALREYGARSTAPTVEDVGEAALVDGRAYVPVDARFSDVLDRRVAYHVFVTPEGDCNGLYVTQKSAAGFAVRELRGGRSSLAFEYRIVAKPLDEDGARLAAMPREAPMPSDGVSLKARSHIPVPLSPQERLKRRIGVERYAQEMTALRERQIATP